MESILKYTAVAIGGAVGAMLRFFVGNTVVWKSIAPFPLATFAINVTGSFILGFFSTLAAEKLRIDPYLRLMVAVGFVGAYTTFSTFEYETARLVEDREWLYAGLNVVLSFVIGFAAVWGGIVTARELVRLPANLSGSVERSGTSLQADPISVRPINKVGSADFEGEERRM